MSGFWLLGAAVAGLIVTELAGFTLPGFQTISDRAQHSWRSRLAVALLFVVGLAWWLVHSAPS